MRLPSDVLLHGPRRYPIAVAAIYPPLGEARLYKVVRRGKLPPATHRRNVGLWSDGTHRCNLVLASVQGAKEPWVVITDEPPTLQTLWQYAPDCFGWSSCFWIASRGHLNWKIRVYAQPMLWNAYISSLRSRSYMPRLRAWQFKLQACDNRLTLTGDAASVISKSGCVTSRVSCTKDAPYCVLSLSCPKTQSQVLLPCKLSEISMTRFGSPASVP